VFLLRTVDSSFVQVALPELPNSFSQRVRNIIAGLRKSHHRHMSLVVVPEDSPRRLEFLQHLVRQFDRPFNFFSWFERLLVQVDDRSESALSYYELLLCICEDVLKK
jgi:hypothetical protein